MKTKTVLLAIQVPKGSYCCDITKQIRCDYFDPLFGICEYGMCPEYIRDEGTYKKPKECR